MSEPAFLEHIDKTHPASQFAATSEFDGFIEDVQAAADAGLLGTFATPSDELTAEEQSAIDSIGDHSTGDVTPAYANWKRGDLNTRATELGIEEPAELPNKEAVIAAIEEAEAK